ncbi:MULTISPECIES: aspartyl/asparaginyl beta-hydroxylase domain-containing protein [unclassified Streptomyces]|uniref:aspartyl/asparaginyl beta-hydroxylase domain-containing protein n=1 Tax=unclassified Streptomyces TaxID=2593676 RepID=UPI00190664AD|nr:aspartyl/asparaginyl beta-hydroxylase domain-containing protein [Streptomyces sp. HSG2]
MLPLRSPEGSAERTDPGGLGLVEYGDTPWLAKVPYIKSILDSLPTELRAVRLMSLGPGAEVDEHRDMPYGLPAGWVRLHIPFVTNQDAVCTLDGEPQTWQPGTFWFGDFSRPHSVRNGGSERRVHLVIDAFVTPELLELFPAEFQERIRWSEVLLHRPELPLEAPELADLESTFNIPEAFLYGEPEELAQAVEPDRDARLRVDGRRLVMDVDGEPRVALQHVGEGEFRALGWTAERTVKVEPTGDGLLVRFRMRHGSRMTEATREAVRSAVAAVSAVADAG